MEDLYRANFNLGSIHFRNGQHSRAMRCFEQSKESARKTKDKFSESECFHSIGKVTIQTHQSLGCASDVSRVFESQAKKMHLPNTWMKKYLCQVLCVFVQILLHLGDFAAARRSLKKSFCLGSQQPAEREAVKRDFKHGEKIH